MSRRTFLKTSITASAVAATGSSLFADTTTAKWTIGCFNRPWMQAHGSNMQPLDKSQPANWGYDVALKGIKEAGYKVTGLLTRMPDEPFIGVDATAAYLETLKKKIKAAGLVANMGALRTRPDLELADAIKDTRKQIDNGKVLGLETLLTFGVDKADQYETYYKLMADAADYAHEQGIKVVLKPHGGGSGAAEEIQRCLAKVNRPNLKIWYDAGTLVYYTGLDPVEQLKPIVQHVTGLCAKDCREVKGNVMIPFGTGKANFEGVFAELKKAGFNGPVMVECAAGKNYKEVTEGARFNRKFLEKMLAAL